MLIFDCENEQPPIAGGKSMKLQGLVYTFLFCIAAAVTGTAQAPAQAGTATTSLSPRDQAMIGNENAFIVASKKRDTDYFKRTLTADYSQLVYDGQLHDRAEIDR